MKAKAVVFEDRMNVVFREVEVPEPGDGQVVIELDYSWISIGTESSFLRGERISGNTPLRPDDPSPFPHVAGYQKTGVIREVGAKVKGLFYPWAGHVNPVVTNADQVWKLPEGADPICLLRARAYPSRV